MPTSRPRGIIINHGDASLSLNRRDNKMFVTMKRGDSKITMALSTEEALVVGQYLLSYAQVGLLSQGIVIGSKKAKKEEEEGGGSEDLGEA